MKKLTFVLLLISLVTYSQKLKEKIQGDWVCVKILDSKGKPTIGKFGASNEFLKFSFKKNTFSVSESPFDKGLTMDIVFKNDNSFDWLPDAIYDLPERIYKVNEINDNNMILTTKSLGGDSIFYHFLNQKNFPYSETQIIDNGILIVKHLRSSKTSKGSNRVSEYQISNDSIHLFLSPSFEYSGGGNFGELLSINVKLPEDFPLDKVSDELTLDFDVTEKGAQNFKIIKGLGDNINSEVIRVMEKLHKSWKPLVINKKPVKATLRFHIYFYMTIVELQLPWKH